MTKYIELTDEDEILQEGDEFLDDKPSELPNQWYKIPPMFYGNTIKEFKKAPISMVFLVLNREYLKIRRPIPNSIDFIRKV